MHRKTRQFSNPECFFHSYKISMNVPAEFTIVSMQQLIVQIHLAPTSAPASLVTVETAEIIAFQTVRISLISLSKS